MKRVAGYILRDRKVLPVADIVKWATWFESADRRVAVTEFLNTPHYRKIDTARLRRHEEIRKSLGLSQSVEDIQLAGRMIVVSTVFLGLNHNWHAGPPLTFETMIFNGPLNEECWRYVTWEEAEAGHAAAIEAVRAALAASVVGATATGVEFMTIYKIQIPLAGSGPLGDAPLLAYPRLGHPVFHIFPDQLDASDLARIHADCGASGKAYYDCTPSGVANSYGLIIGARVPDQRW